MAFRLFLPALLLFALATLALAVGPDRPPPHFVISLDAPASERWGPLAAHFQPVAPKLVRRMIGEFLPQWAVKPVEAMAAALDEHFAAPFPDEMRGIASGLNLTLGEVVAINLVYDASAFCTSIVAQRPDGSIIHGRNLDFNGASILRAMTATVDFTSNSTVQYSATTYASYVGILTGLRPKAFTVTVDERDSGHWWENAIQAIFNKKAQPMSFTVRETLASENNFTGALATLSTRPLIAPVYFILGGTRAGEGAVITRDRLKAKDVWHLKNGIGSWYVLETNYDRTNAPPEGDQRRIVATTAMNRTGQDAMTLKSLFRVLSTRGANHSMSVLNNATTYTTVFTAAHPELSETVVRWSMNYTQ